MTATMDTPVTRRPRAIPGRRRYKVTVGKPDGDMVHRHLSEHIAKQIQESMSKVMFMQSDPEDDDAILSVKIEPEFDDA